MIDDLVAWRRHRCFGARANILDDVAVEDQGLICLGAVVERREKFSAFDMSCHVVLLLGRSIPTAPCQKSLRAQM